jgi:hypothetical protein
MRFLPIMFVLSALVPTGAMADQVGFGVFAARVIASWGKADDLRLGGGQPSGDASAAAPSAG